MKILAKHILVSSLTFFCSVNGYMEGFIVDGENTTNSEYPHAVFLDARCLPVEHWICGSSLLNQKTLLTAAHCVTGCNWADGSRGRLIAFIGHEDLSEVTIKRKVIDVRVHDDFGDVTMENDIAVALFRRDINLGDNAKRVIITQQSPGVRFGYVAGWGLWRVDNFTVEDDSEETSMILKHVRQKIRSARTCNSIGHLHDGMFCAGSTEKKHSHPARGDSGSAMVTRTKFHQIGLVSFCIKRLPALMVYTNVSYYYEWIVYNCNDLYCNND